jgi:hypothetical protein
MLITYTKSQSESFKAKYMALSKDNRDGMEGRIYMSVQQLYELFFKELNSGITLDEYLAKLREKRAYVIEQISLFTLGCSVGYCSESRLFHIDEMIAMILKEKHS